ncbi:hypothetical protein C7S20_03565 [Christiangramia fulva]|uniref:Lipoprotein n=1 Tax=Christiangramia fulva TaxID=2126553 RepID=A0A2R3Z2D5_9FLAO|nr:hypothetical protein [Christiangramia fulva]AVR44408.1 hypothetical protein C7S20_03565 [Christiangramia fulva]
MKNYKSLIFSFLFIALSLVSACKNNSENDDREAMEKTQNDPRDVVEIKAIDYAFQCLIP